MASKNETEKRDAVIATINNLINQYVRKNGTHENKMFCESQGSLATIPQQGWKFHLSATTLEDYAKLLEMVLPELDAHGVKFKIVQPLSFDELQSTDQKGKNIVIYPTPAFNLNAFSQECVLKMFESVDVQVTGDLNFGRLNARYGCFHGNNTSQLIDPTGALQDDERHIQACPDFIVDRDLEVILNFYSDALQRYHETGDYKTYVQETALMARGNGVDAPFIAVSLTEDNEETMEIIADMDPSGKSFIYELNDERFLMVYSDYIDSMLHQIDELSQLSLYEPCETAYQRPDWDFRYNLYQIPAEQVADAVKMIDQYNRSLQHADTPRMLGAQLDYGVFYIQVETVLNRTFQEQCLNYQIQPIALATNQTQSGVDLCISEQQELINADHEIDRK